MFFKFSFIPSAFSVYFSNILQLASAHQSLQLSLAFSKCTSNFPAMLELALIAVFFIYGLVHEPYLFSTQAVTTKASLTAYYGLNSLKVQWIFVFSFWSTSLMRAYLLDFLFLHIHASNVSAWYPMICTLLNCCMNVSIYVNSIPASSQKGKATILRDLLCAVSSVCS